MIYNIQDEINHAVTFINLEDFSLKDTKNLKFAVPTILPGLNTTSVIENKVKTTNSHIINKNDIPNEDYIICNYIVADLPHSIAKQCPHNINKKSKKGQKFIGVFVNGETMYPKILQRGDY